MGRVVCAGSINMDIVATAARHPLPGETVSGLSLAYFPGGKGANQAVAAARMGADTAMLGSVGDDAFGAEMLAFLSSAGVDTTGVATVPGPTGTALIIVAKAENAIVVVPGANGHVDARQLVGHAGAGDIVVSQFEIPRAAVTQCFRAAKGAGARTVLNAAPAADIPTDLAAVSDIVVLNESELAHVTGRAPRDARHAIALARELRRDPSQIVIVTMGAAGAVALDGDDEMIVAGLAVHAVDSTGAGDCFVGTLAAQLSAVDDLRTAVETANVAASICVTRLGAGPSLPSIDDVRRALGAAEGPSLWPGR